MSSSRLKSFTLGLAAITLVGLLLRLACAYSLPIWYDEAGSLLHISGATEETAIRELSSGGTLQLPTLLRFQRPIPGTHLNDVARNLKEEEPQLPPLFFLMLRLWALVFGCALAALRLLPVLIGAALIPSCALLAWEALKSARIALIFAGIVAVSPIFVYYSTELRHYCLLALMTALSSAFLLRSLRSGSAGDRTAYFLTLVAGFYSHLLFAPLALAQFAVLACRRKEAAARALLGAWIAAALLFAPWLLWVRGNIQHAAGNLNWLLQPPKYFSPLFSYLINSNLILATFEWGRLAWYPLVLAAAGAGLLWKRSTVEARFLLAALLFTTCLVSLFPDLAQGGVRSSLPRYSLALFLILGLSIACLLDAIPNRFRRWLIGGVAAAGLLSSYLMAHDGAPWARAARVINYPEAAGILARLPRPLIMSDADMTDLFVLGDLLERAHSRGNLHFRLSPTCMTCVHPQKPEQMGDNLRAGEWQPALLFSPSEKLKSAMAAHHALAPWYAPPVPGGASLWLIKF